MLKGEQLSKSSQRPEYSFRTGETLQVLIDSGNAPPRTGIGVYGQGLLHALKQYCSDRVSVSETGISLVGNTFRPIRRLAYLFRLRQLAEKDYGGADIVHFTNIYVPKRHHRASYVVTIHDLDAIERPEFYTRRYSLYYHNSVQRAIERANVVMTDTHSVREKIIEHYRLPGERVASMGIGLHSDFKEAVDAIQNVDKPEFKTLLFVGRLEKKKNLVWLIRTVSEGIRSGRLRDLRLILAGNKGFGFEEIEAALKEAGSLARWVASPSIHHLATLYRRASVIVLPSFCEGFGLPLLEAMYCGKPIVASKIPTSIEVTGGAACFFSLGCKEEFYDAVDTTLADSDMPGRLESCSKQLKKYAWEHLVEGYVEVYQRVSGVTTEID
jgi:glycosyltransferase involved in cell wall biosynthesis